MEQIGQIAINQYLPCTAKHLFLVVGKVNCLVNAATFLPVHNKMLESQRHRLCQLETNRLCLACPLGILTEFLPCNTNSASRVARNYRAGILYPRISLASFSSFFQIVYVIDIPRHPNECEWITSHLQHASCEVTLVGPSCLTAQR